MMQTLINGEGWRPATKVFLNQRFTNDKALIASVAAGDSRRDTGCTMARGMTHRHWTICIGPSDARVTERRHVPYRCIGLWSDVRVRDAGVASLYTWKGGNR